MRLLAIVGLLSLAIAANAEGVKESPKVLRPGDGAIGGHQAAVQEAYRDFRALALKLLSRMNVVDPSTENTFVDQ